MRSLLRRIDRTDKAHIKGKTWIRAHRFRPPLIILHDTENFKRTPIRSEPILRPFDKFCPHHLTFPNTIFRKKNAFTIRQFAAPWLMSVVSIRAILDEEANKSVRKTIRRWEKLIMYWGTFCTFILTIIFDCLNTRHTTNNTILSTVQHVYNRPGESLNLFRFVCENCARRFLRE